MIHVALRILGDALFCFRNQILSVAKLCRAGGARFRAGRLQSTRNAVETHVALSAKRQGFVPLVLWNRERTCQHAIAAPHAPGGIVGDWSIGCFLERADRADRSTAWILTVHAEPPHELIVFCEYDGELV